MCVAFEAAEITHTIVQRHLTIMTKGRMANIVSERCRLNDVRDYLIFALKCANGRIELDCDRLRNLCDFKGMRQSVPEEILIHCQGIVAAFLVGVERKLNELFAHNPAAMEFSEARSNSCFLKGEQHDAGPARYRGSSEIEATSSSQPSYALNASWRDWSDAPWPTALGARQTR